jgi:hypothetical protein
MFPSGRAGCGAPALRAQTGMHLEGGCRHFLQMARVQRCALALRLDAVGAADAPTQHSTPRQKRDISVLPYLYYFYSFLFRFSRCLLSFRSHIS